MPTPIPLLPVSMLYLFLSVHVCHRSRLPAEKGVGGELWPSINHSILTGRKAIWGEQKQKSTGHSQSCRTVPLREKFFIYVHSTSPAQGVISFSVTLYQGAQKVINILSYAMI
jgi:hypothetical protein